VALAPPDGLFGPSNGNGELSLAPGLHRLEIRAIDPAGNESVGRIEVDVRAGSPLPTPGNVRPATQLPAANAEIETRRDGLVVRLPAGATEPSASVSFDGEKGLEPVGVVAGSGGLFAFLRAGLDGPMMLRIDGVGSVRLARSRSDRPVLFPETPAAGEIEVLLPRSTSLFASFVDPRPLVAAPLPLAARSRPGAFRESVRSFGSAPTTPPTSSGFA